MKLKILILTKFIFALKWGIFGLLLNLDLYIGYKMFKPFMGTDPKGWRNLFLVILPFTQFIILYIVVVGKIDKKWFDAKWLTSRILER